MSKSLSGEYSENVSIVLKNQGQLKLQQMHLKLFQEEQFKKQQK